MDLRPQFRAPRYSSVPFPPYRFQPGVDPHPTADPRGHSHRAAGRPDAEIALVPPEAWKQSPDYLFGCDLYNHAYWWEAHEAWEGLWQLTDKRGLQGQFLQGLIQVSACHLKLFVAHYDGVTRLLAGASGYLSHVAAISRNESYMGLRVARFVSDVRAYYGCGPNDLPAVRCHRPSSYPYIRLEGDVSA